MKGFCDKKLVPVPYRKEARLMTIDTFWQAAKTKTLSVTSMTAAERAGFEALFQSVEAARKVVLNPLSHSITQPVTRPEIQAAIDAVQNLRFE